MAIIQLSTALKIGATCGWGQRTYDTSDIGDDGSAQDRIGGEPRWMLTLTQPQVLTKVEAGAWKGMIVQLRGGLNRLQAWDPLNATPTGSLSGGTGSITKGSNTLTVSGSVLAGQMIQVGTGYGTSQLFMAVADATNTITVEPPARQTFSGAAITTTRASSYFRLIGQQDGWRGTGSSGLLVEGISLQLLETWA